MLKKLWEKQISRRRFLKTTGMAAASAALLTACSNEQLESQIYISEDMEKTGIKDDHRNYPYTYKMEDVTKIPTTCYMCAINCATIGVVNKDGVVKRIEPNPIDPVSGGALCARGNAAVTQLYDEERLKTPMRKIGEYEWEQISWDEAFDTIYNELSRIKDEYGPETLLGLNRRGFYNGYYNGFLKAYGTPNGALGQNSICDGSKRVAQELAVGSAGLYCDYKNSDYIVLMGANQMEAPRYRLAMPNDILHAQRNGAKLVVIDPRFNYSAAKADEYHKINAGTDGLMLMSMGQVIIEEDLVDKNFIDSYGVGFEEYKNEVLKEDYKPENVAKEVGISAEDIRRIAIEYASANSGIIDSSSALSMFQNGTQAHWALLNIVAMTGNMLAEGGITRRRSAKVKNPKFEEDNRVAENFWKQSGYISYDSGIESGNRSMIPHLVLNPTEVPTGPMLEQETISVNNGNGIKAVMVYQTDPIGAQAGSEKMKEAFKALEFGVVIDIYLNQTCEALPIGGIALPEATSLERYAARTINSYTPAVALNNALIDPLWDSKSGYWIFVKLGQRFGYEEFLKLDPDAEYEMMMKSVVEAEQSNGENIDWDQIVADGIWQEKDIDARTYNNYDSVFPNGKYYFGFTENTTVDMDKYVAVKNTKVPMYTPPTETTEDYPLRLMAGGKVLWHTQTSTRNNKYLMQIFAENVIVKDTNYIVMSPEDARVRGLKDGEDATIKTPVAQAVGPVLITERMPQGYVHITHGFGHDAPSTTMADGVGINPSALVDMNRVDPHSNTFTVKEEICQVV